MCNFTFTGALSIIMYFSNGTVPHKMGDPMAALEETLIGGVSPPEELIYHSEETKQHIVLSTKDIKLPTFQQRLQQGGGVQREGSSSSESTCRRHRKRKSTKRRADRDQNDRTERGRARHRNQYRSEYRHRSSRSRSRDGPRKEKEESVTVPVDKLRGFTWREVSDDKQPRRDGEQREYSDPLQRMVERNEQILEEHSRKFASTAFKRLH